MLNAIRASSTMFVQSNRPDYGLIMALSLSEDLLPHESKIERKIRPMAYEYNGMLSVK